jgi:hypothetical protein
MSTRSALQNPALTASMLALLAVAWIAARWQGGQPTALDTAFDDEPPERILTLEVWDSLPSRN